MVDHAIGHCRPKNCNNPNYFLLNINLINITDYGLAINYVALTIAYKSNTIS